MLLAVLAITVATAKHSAQEPASIRKIVLPGLDSQVAARLIALDSRLNAVHSPSLAAALPARLGGIDGPFAAFAPILADKRNNDVWEQLVDEYHRMTFESGDALVSLRESPPALGVAWSSGQVRRLCHQRLAKMPRSALASYRQRVDPDAQALLDEGRLRRLPEPLVRLVDDLFCSSVGGEAIDLLGDLAFERGDFEEARRWWKLLLPADDDEDALRFPDPKIDAARVEAKRLLARMFQGRLDEARAELTRYRREHPSAQGSLAGQVGTYAKILDATLNSLAQKRIGNNDEPWTTFGGNASRNRILSQAPFTQLWEDGPTWRVKLPTVSKETVPDRMTPKRSLAFHPVVVNHQVLIADHRSLVSHHLTTGKEMFRFDLKSARLQDPGAGLVAKVPLPRFTLAADHERAFVRLGRQAIGPRNAEATNESYLVCIDLTEPERDKKRLLWHVKASADDQFPAIFEGSPLVYDDRVYIALSRLVRGRLVTSIVCHDRLGRQRWSREVCDTPEFEDASSGPRYRHHLLTWADGQIVYCSHSGAIVAVDAWTGQPTWGVRYPSRGTSVELEPAPRGQTPCVAADGLVVAAPADSDRLFCIDANTGTVNWELEGQEIDQLLGVAQGRIYATTRSGVIALDVKSGRSVWSQPAEGRLPSLGRGLIAGNWLFNPTRDPLLPCRAMTLKSGRMEREAATMLPELAFFEPSMLHLLPVGNFAFGEGSLVIAGQSELCVFVPTHRLSPEPRPHARLEPIRSPNFVRSAVNNR